MRRFASMLFCAVAVFAASAAPRTTSDAKAAGPTARPAAPPPSRGTVTDTSESGPPRLPLYAYGTSYLADDTMNTPGRRYIEQFNDELRPSEFHNFGKNGATVQQVAFAVEATWRPRRDDRGGRCTHEQPVPDTRRSGARHRGGRAGLQIDARATRALPTIIVVKQGRLSAHDYASVQSRALRRHRRCLERHDRPSRRRVFPNVRVVDPNSGWNADTMIVQPASDRRRRGSHRATRLCRRGSLVAATRAPVVDDDFKTAGG